MFNQLFYKSLNGDGSSWHIQNKFHVRKKEFYPAATFDTKVVSSNEPHKGPKQVLAGVLPSNFAMSVQFRSLVCVSS